MRGWYERAHLNQGMALRPDIESASHTWEPVHQTVETRICMQVPLAPSSLAWWHCYRNALRSRCRAMPYFDVGSSFHNSVHHGVGVARINRDYRFNHIVAIARLTQVCLEDVLYVRLKDHAFLFDLVDGLDWRTIN